jgi:hypothetical protein
VAAAVLVTLIRLSSRHGVALRLFVKTPRRLPRGAIQDRAERPGRCAARRSGRGRVEDPARGRLVRPSSRFSPRAFPHRRGQQPTVTAMGLVPLRISRVGHWPQCHLTVDTLSPMLYTRHCDRQLSTRWVARALRDRQESEGAAGPAQTLQKGDGRAPCCDGSLRPEHAGLECAPIEGQSRGPARDGRQWPLAHHVPLGRQERSRAGSRSVSLNGRRRRWRR